MKNKLKVIYCKLLAPIYKKASKFTSYYKEMTNTCKNGCDNCYNYACVLREEKGAEDGDRKYAKKM